MIFIDSIDDSLDQIKRAYDSLVGDVHNLLEKNKKLKEEHYKDEELQRLKYKIDELEFSLHKNSFYVIKEDRIKADEWARIHSQHCKGAHYSYRFYPIPGIGCCGQIHCEKCKQFYEFCSD